MADPFADPFAQDQEYTSQQQTLAGANTPSVAERERHQKADEARTRFGQLGVGRRGMAGLRHVVGSVPLVRHIPPVRRFASPEEGTQEASDLSDYRLGAPGSARVGSFIGSALPYAAGATALPRLFGSLPGALAGNMAIGAGDAKLDPQGNPLTAAMIDALGTIGAWGVGRVLSPRSAVTARAAHAKRGATRRQAMGQLVDDNAVTPRAVRDIMSPPLSVPRIPEGTDLRDMALWGAIGTGIGRLAGSDPILSGVAGVIAPEIRRMGINAANRGIDRLSTGFGSGPTGRRLNEIMFRYANNRVLSDRDRAILHSLGGPGLAETAGVSGTKREQ